MSAGYRPVNWDRTKRVYDAVLLTGVAGYILAYVYVGPLLQHVTRPLDAPTLAMDAYGSCAFVLLTMILAIGPLARLDRRFLPLLYNRRHFGVICCAIAAAHAQAVLGWYFSYSRVPPIAAALGADTSFGQLQGFPFIPFGIAAFLIILLLAATSHDFWLNFLTPPVWKGMHMLIYLAYLLVVLHIAFGELQATSSPLLAVVVALGCAALIALHVTAGRREQVRERAAAGLIASSGWVEAGDVAAIPEARAIIVRLADGGEVAIFRHQRHLSAVGNLCAHQNGPLGEGRIVDGCITCPWHGFQYRPEDGRSPPPFTERVATYRLRLDGRRVLVDPLANPPGTYVAPLAIPEAGA